MEDEVDRLLGGWRKALPEVDVSPLEVLSRVTRLARHLDRQRTAVFARHDLETWSFDVLSALRRATDPPNLSPGQLLAQTLVTSGTMTNRLDHLEQRGLLRRRPDTTDARFGTGSDHELRKTSRRRGPEGFGRSRERDLVVARRTGADGSGRVATTRGRAVRRVS